MSKAAIILASILLLAFSAGLTDTQSKQMILSGGGITTLAIDTGETIAGTGSGRLPVAAVGGARSAYAPAPEEAPAPAVLVYLAVILVGSIIAVGVVRRGEGRRLH